MDASVRMYRTGDLGRILPDGCVEHLGRKDFQVKIGGQKIQVAEIEFALLDHAAVKEAVVTTWDDARGDARLGGLSRADATARAPLAGSYDAFCRTGCPGTYCLRRL